MLLTAEMSAVCFLDGSQSAQGVTMAPMGLGLGWHQQAEVGGKGEAAMAQTQRGSIAKGAREAGETAQLV